MNSYINWYAYSLDNFLLFHLLFVIYNINFYCFLFTNLECDYLVELLILIVFGNLECGYL